MVEIPEFSVHKSGRLRRIALRRHLEMGLILGGSIDVVQQVRCDISIRQSFND